MTMRGIWKWYLAVAVALVACSGSVLVPENHQYPQVQNALPPPPPGPEVLPPPPAYPSAPSNPDQNQPNGNVGQTPPQAQRLPRAQEFPSNRGNTPSGTQISDEEFSNYFKNSNTNPKHFNELVERGRISIVATKFSITNNSSENDVSSEIKKGELTLTFKPNSLSSEKTFAVFSNSSFNVYFNSSYPFGRAERVPLQGYVKTNGKNKKRSISVDVYRLNSNGPWVIDTYDETGEKQSGRFLIQSR